jgi:GntR family transcriptional regulator of vanillate catabolism
MRATLTLRQMLLQGDFQPGERIREVPLAAKLGVSRIPLRLALDRLEHEGLLEHLPTRGFVVQEFTTGDVYDAIELRGTVEGIAARFAAERLNDLRALTDLREYNRRMHDAVKQRQLTMEGFSIYIEMNGKFHEEILKLAQSRFLKRAMDQVQQMPFASPSACVVKQQVSPESHEILIIAVDQHRGLIEAIAGQEGGRAESLAREHARIARRNLAVALSDTRNLELIPGSRLIRMPDAV